MKLSVVIVNYNVRDYLLVCLDSVYKALASWGGDAEVIVVDNASEQSPEADLRRYFPGIIFVRNKKNLGFSKANNEAIKISRGEWVLMLNPDTIVPEDCFERIFAFADKTPDAGVIGARGVSGGGIIMPEHRRNAPTFASMAFKFLKLDRFLLRTGIYKNTYYAYDLPDDRIGEAPITSGSFMLVNKNRLGDKVYFDERYFMFFEDIDLCMTSIEAGLKNYYLPVSFLHFKSTSYDRRDIWFRSCFADNMYLFYSKHYTNKLMLGLLKLSLSTYVGLAKIILRIKPAGDPEAGKSPSRYIETADRSYKEIISMVEEDEGRHHNVISNVKLGVKVAPIWSRF